MRKQTIISVVFLSGMLGLPESVYALEGDMAFHGTLIAPPPCRINEGGQIDVDFGDRVGVNKVDGVNYRTPVNYAISCEPGAGNWTSVLSLSGSSADFDYYALKTNRVDLGVRVYLNDKPFMPNTEVTINLANLPQLEAVPVKRTGGVLTEGGFEASATLQVNYQ